MRCLALSLALSLALLVACAFSVPALAQTNAPPSPAPAQDAATKTDDQKLICVDQDPNTASRLAPKRTCHTKEEWSKLGGVPK